MKKQKNNYRKIAKDRSVEDIVRDAQGRVTKGYSGNPAGMPPGTPSLSRALKKRLRDHPDEEDKIIRAAIKCALMGDMRATELLWNRLDGKVAERHAFEGEHPVTIMFIPASQLIEGTAIEIGVEPAPQLTEGQATEIENKRIDEENAVYEG